MKKFFMILLVLISCFCSAFMISACNKKEDVGQQTTQTQPSDKDNGNSGQTPPSDKDDGNSGQTPTVHTHTIVYHAQVGASCTVAGTKEYWSCSGCGKNFADANGNTEISSLTIPATGHKKIPHEKKDATCTQAGWTAYETCENCNYTTYKEIPANGHAFVDGICSVCKLDTNKYVTVENVLDPTDYLKLKIESDDHIKLPVDITTNPKATHYFRYYYDRYQNEQVTDFTFTESTKIYVRIFNINLANYNFSVANGKATLTKASDWQKNQQLVIIPRQYNGLPVTAIGGSAFHSGQMQEVLMFDEVTTIGGSAFDNCGGLTKVTFGSNVNLIGGYAFSSCTSLTSITIPDSVTIIGGYTFSSCTSLTSVTIPNNVTSIGFSAFCGCSSLTTVNWNATNCTSEGPAGNDSYDYNIFWGCENLTTLNIDDNVTTIPKNAFRACSSLKSVTIPENVESIGDNAFAYCSSLTTVNWNATACTYAGRYYNDNNTVKDYTIFKDCSKLTTLNIGDNVTNIPNYAFRGCSGLTSVTIGNGVTSIGDYTFYDCNGLESITVGENNTAYASQDGILYNKAKTKFIHIPKLIKGAVTIPDSMTSIGNGEFDGCFELESIIVGENNTAYASQDGILYNKAKTKFIHIPKAIKGAVTIPDSVTSIGDSAFRSCSKLISITIPENVKSIGDYAFTYCQSLTTVNWNATNCTYAGRDYGINDDRTIFKDCDKLTTVNIGDNVTSIPEYTFYSCSGLTNVSIGNGVTSIGDYAFYACSKLTSITIPENVKSIGDYAFAYCRSLATVNWNATICTYAGRYYLDSMFVEHDCTIFKDCDKLTTVNIGDNVTTIPEYAFYGCSSLTTITIPNSVTRIGIRAFYNCTSLKTIYCEAESKPYGWSNDWKGNCTAAVVWGYTG